MNRFRANPKLLAPLLAGMAMLGPFSIDAFFPAFRVMEAEFSVTSVAMQQSLSVYLLSFAAMSLVHGPLSDAYGRRGVILWSMLLFAVASAGCGRTRWPSAHQSAGGSSRSWPRSRRRGRCPC